MKYIIVSDLHIRDKIPEYRTESFINDMFDKVKQIKELEEEEQCRVLCAGDVFDRWKTSTELISRLIDVFPYYFYSIYGQHDLPNHNKELLHKSAFGFMMKLGYISNPEKIKNVSIKTFPYGEELPKRYDGKEQIIIAHILTWKDKEPFPDAKGNNAQMMFKRFPKAELIVTGDNHQQFVVTNEKGQVLINPGSMLRTSKSQIDFKPAMFIYDFDSKEVEIVPFELNKNAFREEAIETKELKEVELMNFVENIDNPDLELELNFESNLKQFMYANNIKDKVKSKVYELLEEIK